MRDVAVAARPHDLGGMLALEPFLRLLVPPVLTREPGQRDRQGSWRARRVFDPDVRVDRVRVGPKRQGLSDAQSLVRAREHQLLRRLVGRDGDGLGRELHRDHGSARTLLRTDHQPRGPEVADDHHRLLAAILERELLQLAALAADHGFVQRRRHPGQPLRRPGLGRGCRYGWSGGLSGLRCRRRSRGRGLFSLLLGLGSGRYLRGRRGQKGLVEDQDRCHQRNGQECALLHCHGAGRSRVGGGS